MAILQKIRSVLDTPEEIKLLETSQADSKQLRHDFKLEIATRNLAKSMHFWLWAAFFVEGFRSFAVIGALDAATDSTPLFIWALIALYWLLFLSTAFCLLSGLVLLRNAEQHYRFILFMCNTYMLVYLLRGVAFTVLDLESGVVGFSLIVSFFVAGCILYHHPLITVSNTLLTLIVFFAIIWHLDLEPLLDPMICFRICCTALLSMTISFSRYRAKYKSFLKERSLQENAEELNRLNTTLGEKQSYIQAQNKKLQVISDTDELTGLGSRHRLLKDGRDILARAAEKKQFVTVAIADIDNFKLINDTYGHTIGDACLHAVGQVFLQEQTEGISVYRFGGDEMLLLLEGKSRSDAFLVMNRILKAVSNLQVPHCGRPITLSCGIYAQIPNPDSHMDTFLEEADRRLYRAKDAGKNQIYD